VRHKDWAALVWTQPEGEAHYRYGVIRSAVVDAQGMLQGSLGLLDGPGLDTQPAVASDEHDLAVTWMSEGGSAPGVYFRRLSDQGLPLEDNRLVAAPTASQVFTAMLPDDVGFRLLWTQRQWTQTDGLYALTLAADGTPQGMAEQQPWIVTNGGDWATVPQGQGFIVAWGNELMGFPGMYVTSLPLPEAPIAQVSASGHGPILAATGLGFGLLWRESQSGSSGQSTGLFFQSFDQDGQPLGEPRQLDRSLQLLLSPRLAYLGGVFVAVWRERIAGDPEEDEHIKAMQLSEDGQVIAGPQELALGAQGFKDLVLVRLAEEVLLGYINPGEQADSVGFGRFTCASDP
jgi:hypothetical protein